MLAKKGDLYKFVNVAHDFQHVQSLFQCGRWEVHLRQPGSEPNLSSTLREIGLNSDSIIKQAQTDEIEQKYLKNTEMAKNKGIFGSPTFIVENEVFWGDDRCEDAIKWLSK